MSLQLSDYKFKTYYWPPPKECRDKDTYLIGFDEDNQPYILRWESQKGYEGWIAATLSENKASGASAVPRHFIDDTVSKLIQYWAYAPALVRTVFRAQAENKKKDKRDEY